MLGICVESSHDKGMGHVFRAINLAKRFEEKAQPFTFFINQHLPALELLESENMPCQVADLKAKENWEERLINDCNISLWINDRLNTDLTHARHIKDEGIPLVTFDDKGEGANISDLNITALAFDKQEDYPGLRKLEGIEFLILNPDIDKYKRERHTLNRIVVSMGGSDTYGLTVKVAEMLSASDRDITIICGPGFEHAEELEKISTNSMSVKNNVSSLAKEFLEYDLAITAGGITPFEANASGLPCVVIASEDFEIPVGQGLAEIGSSVYAGFRENIDNQVFNFNFDLNALSRAGLEKISLNGAETVADQILALLH